MIMVVVWLVARPTFGGEAPGYFSKYVNHATPARHTHYVNVPACDSFLSNTRVANNISAARVDQMLRSSARRSRGGMPKPLGRDVILNNPYRITDHLLETSQQQRSSGDEELRRHYNYARLKSEANTFHNATVARNLPAPHQPAGEDAYLLPLLDIVSGRRAASRLPAAPGDLTTYSTRNLGSHSTDIEKDFADLKNFQKRKAAKRDLTFPLILPLQPH
ncbi:hypothetical protein HW555_010595 [Spodoptera exigua]|uniref:Uncharacterized protein n=1 Tax=Spodoptera exigua TaxID=7107 RepID=A0A835L2F5_SPOEX|nr:hypothetical protein HW555_010595 [Spodoptera exigua]